MTLRAIAAAIVAVVTILFALAPLARGEVELPTAQHHLLHTAILAGAVLSGILAWNPARARASRFAPCWLLVAVLAPILAMFLMWPSDYAFLDRHPGGHAVEHLGLVLLGFLTAFAGQGYASGIGWTLGAGLLAMALLAPLGFGVSPPLAAIAQMPTAAPIPNQATAAIDVEHGAAVYAQNCASCHGANGQGGVGPSLKNERARKDAQRTAQWIEHPSPPMPKLYPSSLTGQDVRDVAAFVQKF